MKDSGYQKVNNIRTWKDNKKMLINILENDINTNKSFPLPFKWKNIKIRTRTIN